MEEDELCFPQLLNTSCKKPKPPHSETVFIYILLFFISVLTAALNLLVIISISHYRQLHSPTNLLLLSLAVSDFFVGFLQLPAEMLIYHGCWLLGDFACALNVALGFILNSVSVGNMVLMSVDRYVAICEPMYYPIRVTARAMRSHVAVVKLQCSVTVTSKKSELKAARNLGVLVVVFLLCFSPYYCFSVAAENSWISAFQICLLYFNSCLNPVIYAFFYPWFRKAVKHIVTLQILQPGSSEANVL
ncbi:trace amine-associated receptor 13c-like [Lates calcarifer]|uniref:Trace amine-associated receptor 13c-like n=1 Tax=Lates calcarifer TaxID=8187 RepID=A0AAJ8B2X9_LATCA|nr:trace amine-associated receptor 13c-like [Lates calcarifer]